MPFNPGLAKGYAPTVEEILEDIGVESPEQVRTAILNRCEQIRIMALQNKDILTYRTNYGFINCDSSQFYKTIINIGYGSGSLVIKDDYGPDVYFLMFKDKTPIEFRPIVAAHEAYEYSAVKKGIDQKVAHEKAQALEIKTAKKLNLKEKYSKFLKDNYPMKFEEMKKYKLI